MVHPKDFVESLQKNGVRFFAGVPDSLIKDLIAYIEDKVPKDKHITAANEGNAIGVAAGYHLGTGEVASVYMQNSGLGNAVNPLMSLADKEVYSIPLLLIIGWRGEPGVRDEPQHVKQGRITEALLKVMEIPYIVFSASMSKAEIDSNIDQMTRRAKKERRPCAILIKKGVFAEYKSSVKRAQSGSLTREEAIQIFVETIEPEAAVISTTGKISRELYEVRKRLKIKEQKDFLTVGSMGHASQIALGLAVAKDDRSIYCLDGDGATIMHMGSLATVGWVAPNNFKHIVLNNLAHESVGGQASAALTTNLAKVAEACGYRYTRSVSSKDKLKKAIQELRSCSAPSFLEVTVNLESRKDLGRPKETPIKNKEGFIKFLNR